MSSEPEKFQRDARAQAATWLARMRSDSRTQEDEVAFRTWLTEDTLHGTAFASVTEVWEAAGTVAEVEEEIAAQRSVISRRALVMGSIAAAAAAGTWWGLTQTQVYETLVGEQRRLTLADGSSVLLDTNTRITLHFSSDRRSIALLRGRAHFSVAKDPSRPFQVQVSDRTIAATGTAFDVADFNGRLSVVLIEGHVVVQQDRKAAEHAEYLDPGDRLRFVSGGNTIKDRPDLRDLSAWQSGRVIFSNTLLADAVAEMNRYYNVPLVIASKELAERRISGVYTTSDPEAFAHSIAMLLSASVENRSSRMILKLK